MKQAERKLIDKIAKRVLELFHETAPILNMEKFVNKLGGKLVTDYSIIDGKIRKDGEHFEILVASDDFNDRRTRFTIAHEIGHLFLHMGFLSDPDRWQQETTETYNRLGTSKEESEANEFAAAFLMPKKEYREQIKNNIVPKNFSDGIQRVDMKKIADFFQVSPLAAVNRGKFLGVLKW